MNADIEQAIKAWLVTSGITQTICLGLDNVQMPPAAPCIIAVATNRERVVSTLSKFECRIIVSTPSHATNTLVAHRTLVGSIKTLVEAAAFTELATALTAVGATFAGLFVTGEETDNSDGRWNSSFVFILGTK